MSSLPILVFVYLTLPLAFTLLIYLSREKNLAKLILRIAIIATAASTLLPVSNIDQTTNLFLLVLINICFLKSLLLTFSKQYIYKRLAMIVYYLGAILNILGLVFGWLGEFGNPLGILIPPLASLLFIPLFWKPKDLKKSFKQR